MWKKLIKCGSLVCVLGLLESSFEDFYLVIGGKNFYQFYSFNTTTKIFPWNTWN